MKIPRAGRSHTHSRGCSQTWGLQHDISQCPGKIHRHCLRLVTIFATALCCIGGNSNRYFPRQSVCSRHCVRETAKEPQPQFFPATLPIKTSSLYLGSSNRAVNLSSLTHHPPTAERDPGHHPGCGDHAPQHAAAADRRDREAGGRGHPDDGAHHQDPERARGRADRDHHLAVRADPVRQQDRLASEPFCPLIQLWFDAVLVLPPWPSSITCSVFSFCSMCGRRRFPSVAILII